MWDVVVIGAGYCGVTAAVEIQRRMPEARILLLEAADRLGGRARSFPVPTTPVPTAVGTEVRQSLDLGAHYFGTHHTRVRALAQRLLEPAQIYNHVPTYGTNPASPDLPRRQVEHHYAQRQRAGDARIGQELLAL